MNTSNTVADNDELQSYAPTATPSLPTAVLIRLLPLNTTEEALRLIVVWSSEYVGAEVLTGDKSDDPGFRSAVLRFKTHRGAMEAKNMLHDRLNGDAKMIVTFFPGAMTYSRRPTVDYSADPVPSTSTSSTASSNGPPNRQSSRFNGSFQSAHKVSPPSNPAYASNELPNPGNSAHYQSLFSPQSPIGNHLNERTRISGKSMINNAANEEDTEELLKDPVAYAEHSSGQARRATIPDLPISRFESMSLNTSNPPGSGTMPAQGSNMTPQAQSSFSNPMSPAAMGASNGGPPVNYQLNSQHYQRHNFPPVNPADQNPPCNTLYVGNLPIDTSEDELKAMFSKQRGYKRLCFRTKQNGPMCFVEFEDVSFATKALHELYGHPLHNSIKGGIRLSFSKNPLGVRSGQGMSPPGPSNMPGSVQSMNGMMMGGPGSFSSVNGPPPGLAAPPGLNSSRMSYAQNNMGSMNGNTNGHYGHGPSYAQNGYNQQYAGPMQTGGPGGMINNNNQGFPPYMLGR